MCKFFLLQSTNVLRAIINWKLNMKKIINLIENDLTAEQSKMCKQVAAIRSFYHYLALYLYSFAIWPLIYLIDENPDKGDVLFMVIYMAIIYMFVIGLHVNAVFRPFAEKRV
jgi:hypothetical protein